MDAKQRAVEPTIQDPTRVRATSMDGACEMIGIGRTSMRRLLREGKIPAVKIGDRWIIPIKSIEAFLEPKHEVRAAPREGE